MRTATMSKKQSERASVKISKENHRKAVTLAGHLNEDLGDLLDRLLKSQLDTMYAEMGRQIVEGSAPSPQSPPPPEQPAPKKRNGGAK